MTRAPVVAAPAALRLLHVAAEVFPLVKTGGLADVVAALPPALARAGADARLLLPGLPAICETVLHQRTVCEIGPVFGAARVSLRCGQMPFTHVPAYVLDAPYLYRRDGGPYQDGAGREWPDNLQRFALLGWAAAHLAAGELDPAWTPDVVHAHDWHAAAACAYMAAHPSTEAASVFTVHNLAYQGLFAPADFGLLGLPSHYMNAQGLEFHGQLSLMKAGLQFAGRVTTVSPGYAREIATPEFGFGLDGVVRSRGAAVTGILNGVDGEIWNPATDAALAEGYDGDHLDGKAACKRALQSELGLAVDAAVPVLCVVSRLTEQKGLDLLLGALPALLQYGAALAVLGSGDAGIEAALSAVARAHPGRVAVRIGYDEALAHRMIAGADAILVPSRFEPCGLTQLYGFRYGTLPVVRRVGGLADTVVDAAEGGRGTGFAFDAATPEALGQAVMRCIAQWRRPEGWQALMRRAMAQDFSWDAAAAGYLALYADLLGSR